MTGVLGFAGITGPDPDGWITWTTEDPALYNAQVLGPLRVRVEGSQIRVRMAVRPLHANVNGAIHGGATLGLIDVALFAILRASGASVAVATVTLDLSTQFLAPGGSIARSMSSAKCCARLAAWRLSAASQSRSMMTAR